VDLSEVALSLISLAAESGAAVSITACTGSIVDLTVTDASATLDESPLTVSGRVELSGALAQVALTQKVLDAATLSVADGADLTVATCSGTTTLSISGTATISDSSLSFASAGVSVSGTATFTGGSLSFAASGFTVQTGGGATFTDTSLSFAVGVQTGLDVQEGGAATATGTTFTVADDTTVAVRVPEGYTFVATASQLVGADGGTAPLWPAEVALCDCGGHGDTCVSPRGDCECALCHPTTALHGASPPFRTPLNSETAPSAHLGHPTTIALFFGRGGPRCPRARLTAI
jgi:hypothetical protein